jgi:hypothetical protein
VPSPPGRADHDGVIPDDGRRVQPDVGHRQGVRPRPGEAAEVLIEVLLQVDDAIRAERGNGRTGPGIERLHSIAGRHVDDACLATVGPVEDPATGPDTRREFRPKSLVFVVDPEQGPVAASIATTERRMPPPAV